MTRRQFPILLSLGLLLLTYPSPMAFGQDISIPGVNSKYNTDKLIEETMKAERIPLERLKEEKGDYAEQKRVWNEMSRKLAELSQMAQKLYGFENPFQEYIASPDNSSILGATANRNAEQSTHQVEVLQVASRDEFLSRSLPDSYEVPAGEYRFGLGDEEVTVSFDGGDLDDFAEELNRKGKELISARTVRDTADTQVLVIRGGETGAEQTLSFSGAARELGLDTGLLTRSRSAERSISPSPANVSAGRGGAEAIELSEEAVRVAPQSSAQLRISPGAELSGSRQLKIHLRLEQLPEESRQAPDRPPGPSIPEAGGVELEGVRIQNSGTQVELPEVEEPEPPRRVETLKLLKVNGQVELPELKESSGPQTLTLDAEQLPDTVTSIDIDNRNTHRAVHLTGVELVDPEARGEFKPAKPVSTAADAKLRVDGVTITRSGNEIDDVISGVTLRPKRTGGPTQLNIDPDTEAIKNAIINFAGSYNQVLTDIQILTSTKEAVIDEISYFNEEQREEAREKLGLFQGATTFMQLRNRLQRIITAPYDTSAGNRLAMLSQIGISTNASGFGGGVTRSRLRGYMEVNEGQLDRSIETQLPAIKELFGRDTNGDLVVDSGLAYDMHSFVQEYTRTGGIISTRVAGLDRRIENTEEEISDMQDDLARKEQSLKRKYGRMESNIGRLQENSSAIDRLNNSGGQ